MADVRALLAAERQSRRISHPHLTYSKTGLLTCNICNLNVKSEQLWPGHLKSSNHRKNLLNMSDPPTRLGKRKIDNVEEEQDEPRNYEVDSRKKPRPSDSNENVNPVLLNVAELSENPAPDTISVEADIATPIQKQPSEDPPLQALPLANPVDEDEWAAFERDVAVLDRPEYTLATIEAAPVSARQLADQQEPNTVQKREDEAEAEKEDEGRRLEEEFEVMEEMEDRLKRLRDRREALRIRDNRSDSTHIREAEAEAEAQAQSEPLETVNQLGNHATIDSSSDADEVDDWYS